MFVQEGLRNRCSSLFLSETYSEKVPIKSPRPQNRLPAPSKSLKNLGKNKVFVILAIFRPRLEKLLRRLQTWRPKLPKCVQMVHQGLPNASQASKIAARAQVCPGFRLLRSHWRSKRLRTSNFTFTSTSVSQDIVSANFDQLTCRRMATSTSLVYIYIYICIADIT